MARRKNPKQPNPTRHGGRGPILMGDVRPAPIELREGNRVFNPVIALWVRAEDGYVVGQLVDEPGHPAQTLVNALREPVPVPGHTKTTALPSRVLLFDRELAEQVAPLLAPLNVEVSISPRFEPFEELFAGLFSHLQQAQPGPLPDLPEDMLGPLVSAAERLWRAKPWDFAFDYPPFALVPFREEGRPLYASILGANREVFGVAIYRSAEDYEDTVKLGETMALSDPEAPSPEALDAAASRGLGVLRHRAFLLSFEPKGDLPSAYREQLLRGGWPGRLRVAPTFLAMGGGQDPEHPTDEEAAEAALAIDALVSFCRRHRRVIAEERFPIRDTVEVDLGGKTVRVYVTVPG